MRAFALCAVLLLCGSAAPLPPVPPAQPTDPMTLREVRTCVAELWDAETPMCIERSPVRMDAAAAVAYATEQLYRTGSIPAADGQRAFRVEYLAEVCRPIPAKGFAFPRTIEERTEHCTLYMLPK